MVVGIVSRRRLSKRILNMQSATPLHRQRPQWAAALTRFSLIGLTACCVALLSTSQTLSPASAQGPPAGTGQPSLPMDPNAPPPSLQQSAAGMGQMPPNAMPVNRGAAAGNAPPQGSAAVSAAGNGQLPQTNGQVHRIYDLRGYTGYLPQSDRPHQAVVDWIIRETGTDVWFTEPFGFISASRDSLSVYHTPEVHQVVAAMVERFTAGDKDPQTVQIRVMTVGSPNWRTRSHMLMQHVSVNSPGLQAWLLTKENAAMVMAMLRQRSDVREVQAIDMVTHNGQSETLASTRGRNYVQNIRQVATGWPPYEPQTGEVQEGYRMQMSPLLSVDRRSLDCFLQVEIDQVDKLVPVELDLPLPSGEMFRAKVDVPQVVSWRLKERFRWPTDMVLLLSCGVVASPERSTASTIPLLNMNTLTGTTPGRADALMFVEFRGKSAESVTPAPQVADRIGGTGTRGRY